MGDEERKRGKFSPCLCCINSPPGWAWGRVRQTHLLPWPFQQRVACGLQVLASTPVRGSANTADTLVGCPTPSSPLLPRGLARAQVCPSRSPASSILWIKCSADRRKAAGPAGGPERTPPLASVSHVPGLLEHPLLKHPLCPPRPVFPVRPVPGERTG